MQHCAFDYWGSGTEVTVSSATVTAAAPTLFPLVQCGPQDAGPITVGCLAHEFYPKSLTFQWTDASGAALISAQYPSTESSNKYTGVSLLQVSQSDWNSKRPFKCSVTHQEGTKSVTLEKKASSRPSSTCLVASSPHITVTLKPPSASDIFNNNQAKLECKVTRQNQITLDNIQITWKIDGQTVTDNISEPTNTGSSRISTLTRSRLDWLRVKSVSCSANSANMTAVTQDLTIFKADGIKPKVTVHILPEEDISKGDSAEVTLVCLVSSPVQQDYYIAWLEHSGQSAGIYHDGVNFPPQQTKHGFLVTSVYSTSKEKWKVGMFSCNVWPAGSNSAMEPRNVSNAHNGSKESLNLPLAMSCTDEAIEEDEYSSLWSTTSSFIVLFISSLLYSMIFSLVKMKKP